MSNITKQGNTMEDSQLVIKCLDDNSLAQEMLFNKYASKMLGVCMKYFNSKSEAEDALQDGFIKVFQNLKAFSGNGSLEGWIRRIIVNTSLDAIRKNKKLQLNTPIENVEFSLHSNNNTLKSLEAEDLLKILDTLPLGYKTVFNLYAIEGYSHKEIADELNININTSKSQLSRARKVLQNLVDKYNLK